MSTLLILKGLPSSGKTTHALELVKQGWKRVNKDSLREMIDGGKWSKQNEKLIMETEQELVSFFLNESLNVVVDDTNFAHIENWKNFAEKLNGEFDMGIEVEVKFFAVPLMECIERDAKRGDKSVGAEVIQRMYDKYLKPIPPLHDDKKQNCYVFDIDGTLAHMNGRSPYDYTLVHTDTLNHNIAMIARLLSQSLLPIIVVSGRTDDCKKETKKWLQDNCIPCDGLFMRKSGDKRNDAIVKQEIYNNELKDKYNVLAVFDDRNRVVDMWRELGITCLQVGYGNF